MKIIIDKDIARLKGVTFLQELIVVNMVKWLNGLFKIAANGWISTI